MAQFWKSPQIINHDIRVRTSIGDGDGTLFCLDPWRIRNSFSIDFSHLFALCSDPLLLVASVVRDENWNISFRLTFGLKETLSLIELRHALSSLLSDAWTPCFRTLPLGGSSPPGQIIVLFVMC